jgi:predicted transcriptional regulator of viral defense system
MTYFELCSVLRRNKTWLFTLADVKNLFPGENDKTLKNNLTRWLHKGYLVRLRRDLYEFIEQGADVVVPDLYIANKLYGPSYVSLETALSFYSMIPDIAAGVTSVTTRATRTFKNRHGSFFYRTCRGAAFKGYYLLRYDGFKVCIADKEKALVDFLYYRLRSGHAFNSEEDRLNRKMLKKINWKRACYYAKLFNKKTIEVLKECKEYTLC